MAINFDHTNSSSITLKGQSGSSPSDSFTFILPAVPDSTAVLLTSGSTTIQSISGLETALNSKVSSVGGPALTGISTGNSAGKIPVLNSDGKLDPSIIPSIAVRDTFLVNFSGDVTGLSSAQLGDLAIATGSKINLILNSTGVNAYSGIQNWKPLETSQQTVHSVNGLIGHVVLNGSNVFLSSGDFSSKSLDFAIENLRTNKADLQQLVNFVSTGEFTTSLQNYVTLSGLTGFVSITGSGDTTGILSTTGILNSYLTLTGYNSGVALYQTKQEIQTILSGYVGTGDVGNAYKLNYGTSSGNVVVVESDGKINSSLLPKLAITDTFVLNSTGGLTGLSAQKGDIGIITGSPKANYILTGSDASLISNWTPFAASSSSISSVNGIFPNSGSLTLTSSNILVKNTSGNGFNFDDQTISSALTGLATSVNELQSSYLSSGKASDFLSGYVTTGYASGVFSSKAETGHNHSIIDITNLQTCLDSISAFITGEGLSAIKQKLTVENYNLAKGNYSVAMGYGAIACQDYEIAHAAGWFVDQGLAPGSAQTSKILSRCVSTSATPTQIAFICMDSNSTVSFSADVVGFGSSSRYASFKLDGTAYKGSSNDSVVILGGNSLNTYANSNDAYYISGIADTGNGNVIISVSGVSDATNWITNINLLKIKNPL